MRIHNGLCVGLVIGIMIGWALPLHAAMAVWYRMDEGSGTTLIDATGNGHTAQLCDTATCPSASGPTRGNGKLYGGLTFGASDYVRGDQILTPLGLSYCAWVNSTSTANQDVVGSTQDNNSLRFDAGFGNGNSAVNIWTTAFHAAQWGTTQSTSIWYHLCGTYDNETLRLYVNGGEVAVNTTPTGAVANNGDTVLGVHANLSSNRFVGQMDEVRIYTHGLTAPEVAAVYIRGRVSRR